MVEIKLPEEEAIAFRKFLEKVNYDAISKCCRRELPTHDGRRPEDITWAARQLLLEQMP